MPIYEYECAACRKKFSVLKIRLSEGDVTCAFCGSKDVKKLLSSFCCSTPSPSAGAYSGGGSGCGGGGG